jgi:hypothetical protein
MATAQFNHEGEVHEGFREARFLILALLRALRVFVVQSGAAATREILGAAPVGASAHTARLAKELKA